MIKNITRLLYVIVFTMQASCALSALADNAFIGLKPLCNNDNAECHVDVISKHLTSYLSLDSKNYDLKTLVEIYTGGGCANLNEIKEHFLRLYELSVKKRQQSVLKTIDSIRQSKDFEFLIREKPPVRYIATRENVERFLGHVKVFDHLDKVGANEMMYKGAIANALCALSPDLDATMNIIPDETFAIFFGDEAKTTESMVQRLKKISAAMEKSNLQSFQNFLNLSREQQNEIIRFALESQQRMAQKNKRIENLKTFAYIVLLVIAVAISTFGIYFLTKKMIPILKSKPILVPYLILTLFLIIGATFPSSELFDGYYMLLRLITSALCVYSAVKFKTEWVRWVFGVLAVLYNPILPVHLGDKEIWSIVNIATIAYMWIALRIERRNIKPSA